MKKKFSILVLIVSILMMNTLFVEAAGIQLFSISKITKITTLTISSKGNAISEASGSADSKLFDKMTISISLEKKSGSKWSSVETWTASSNKSSCDISKSTKVTKGSTYRTKAIYTMYKNGKMIEKITDYGSEVSY